MSHAAVKSFVRTLEQLLPVTCTLKLKFKSSNSENYNNAFSLDELTDAISKSHDTAVGPDDIHYHMLKHFPVDPLLTLLNILNSIWASGKFLSSWYTSTVIPVPKFGKDTSDPSTIAFESDCDCHQVF